MNAPTDSYPLRFDVDYPDRPRNRLTTFFRLFTVIPVFIYRQHRRWDEFELDLC